MSAWIVSKTHIDLLVTAFQRWGEPVLASQLTTRWGAVVSDNPAWENTMGQLLWAENVASVQSLYPDLAFSQLPGAAADFTESSVADYEFGAIPGNIDPVVVLASLACYEHQSSERPGWEESEVKQLCWAIQRLTVQGLPGFDEAPWGFDDRNFFTKTDGPAFHGPVDEGAIS